MVADRSIDRGADALAGRTVIARRDFGEALAGACGLIIGIEGGGRLEGEVVVRWYGSGQVVGLSPDHLDLAVEVRADPPATGDPDVAAWLELRPLLRRRLRLGAEPALAGQVGSPIALSYSRSRCVWCLRIAFASGERPFTADELRQSRPVALRAVEWLGGEREA